MRMDVTHRVQKRGHLLLSGFDDVWIRVTGSGDAERGRQIQIFFTFGIPDVNALGTLPNNRPCAVRIKESDVP